MLFVLHTSGNLNSAIATRSDSNDSGITLAIVMVSNLANLKDPAVNVPRQKKEHGLWRNESPADRHSIWKWNESYWSYYKSVASRGDVDQTYLQPSPVTFIALKAAEDSVSRTKRIDRETLNFFSGSDERTNIVRNSKDVLTIMV